MSDEPERPRRESLGDRIERSIDSRTDAVTEIARGEAESAARGPSIRRTAFWLLVTGVSLYLVAPSLIDVLGSWQNLSQIALLWFPLLALLQFASLACIWILQRLTIPRSPWSAVIDSQLAGNALAKIAPSRKPTQPRRTARTSARSGSSPLTEAISPIPAQRCASIRSKTSRKPPPPAISDRYPAGWATASS